MRWSRARGRASRWRTSSAARVLRRVVRGRPQTCSCRGRRRSISSRRSLDYLRARAARREAPGTCSTSEPGAARSRLRSRRSSRAFRSSASDVSPARSRSRAATRSAFGVAERVRFVDGDLLEPLVRVRPVRLRRRQPAVRSERRGARPSRTRSASSRASPSTADETASDLYRRLLREPRRPAQPRRRSCFSRRRPERSTRSPAAEASAAMPDIEIGEDYAGLDALRSRPTLDRRLGRGTAANA